MRKRAEKANIDLNILTGTSKEVRFKYWEVAIPTLIGDITLNWDIVSAELGHEWDKL